MWYPIIRVKYKKGNNYVIREVGRSMDDALYIDKNGGLQYIDLLTKEGTEKIGDKEPMYSFVSDDLEVPGNDMKFIAFYDFEDVTSIERVDRRLREKGVIFDMPDYCPLPSSFDE